MSVPSLAEMRATNGSDVSPADYVHHALRAAELGADFAAALIALLNPRIVEREGRMLVEAVGAPARYAAFRAQGQAPQEAEYWANLTVVSDLLGDLDVPQAHKLAQVLRWSWQNALAAQYPQATQVVRVLEDRAAAEVLVTLSEPPSASTPE
ncbi:MAG: hypothetical protein WDM91_12600 [Rhizomicrobium sp.]